MKKKNKILITGGNGYIGSCLALCLRNKYKIIVLDKAKKTRFLPNRLKYHRLDLQNKKKLFNFLKEIRPEVIVHLAGQSTIDMVDKKKHSYYKNNFIATKNLVDCIKKLKIQNLIFSSTAAVYKKKNSKINEKSKILSSNSYGISKINCELEIKKLESNVSKYCILRFFNVASCVYKNKIGEFHNPETHLIPITIHSILKSKELKIYGDNYKTKDGTCLRDYIHIQDIVNGIEKSIKYLLNNKTKSEIFNLGSGKSYSVKEVVNCASRILNLKTKIKFQKKRKHDASKLVCDIKKAKHILKWKPLFSNITEIIKDEVKWYKYLEKNKLFRKYIY